mmetsp:Transcript_23551/g.28773  ORF Transcript_23551/g.28773 Transcript_23551/m.28773 type:complete len:143 (-) Transcript_23551:705-1133(-)
MNIIPQKNQRQCGQQRRPGRQSVPSPKTKIRDSISPSKSDSKITPYDTVLHPKDFGLTFCQSRVGTKLFADTLPQSRRSTFVETTTQRQTKMRSNCHCRRGTNSNKAKDEGTKKSEHRENASDNSKSGGCQYYPRGLTELTI